MLKEPPGRVRFLSGGEVDELLNACPHYLKSIVIIALNTGMRRSEILTLKWSDIDFKRKTITLMKTKNNEIREIPINNVLYKELRKIPLHIRSNYVFCNRRGEPFQKVQKGFQSALKRAGIEDFRFHDLRHTFASYLVMSGVYIRTVQQYLGHKKIEMTMRYSHLSPSHLEQGVNRLRFGTFLAQSKSSSV